MAVEMNRQGNLEFPMSPTPELHTLPISRRPAQSWSKTFKGVLFAILFNIGCLMINGSQLVFLLPLRFLPFRWSKHLYHAGIQYTKGAFGCLLLFVSQWFAPTKLAITFETQGRGKISPEEIEMFVVRNKDGKVVSLNLPSKFVLIANHQIYADWLYAWCLTYFASPRGVHRYVYITLKKSLQWVPIVGWVTTMVYRKNHPNFYGAQGMQIYQFIFLARSWASDRLELAHRLSALGKATEREHSPLCFMLYPEGTLVSQNTRPISKKFADKMGISDMKNVLLPRSTGLHYTLRSLAPRIPDLRLLDITVVYPGIPPMGYGQDYYTLRSIFFSGVPPPVIHMHLRLFSMTQDVPIGDISASKPNEIPNGQNRGRTVEVDIPVDEKDTFDQWLRELWQEKDEAITKFHESGNFSKENGPVIHIPLKLRRKLEVLDAFCFFLPAGVAYLWGKIRQ